jgi:hypothetical protein
MGESGSGKTTAMRTLKSEETYYIDCDGKGLSWRGWRQQYNAARKNYIRCADQNTILSIMMGISQKRENIKNIVIDTANSIMVDDEFRRMKEKGYDKWQDIAMSVYQIVTTASALRDDMTVIVLFHTQTDVDEATGQRFTRILTNGKKLNKVGLEKYFTTVLLSKRNDAGAYIFETHSNHSTAKTPMDAFENDEIDNDMQAVLDVLAEF